jgi:hypothetical protein
MTRPKDLNILLAMLLLGSLAIQAERLITPARAASKGLQYKIVAYDESNREAVLNKMAEQGWEFAGVESRYGGFIFEKE